MRHGTNAVTDPGEGPGGPPLHRPPTHFFLDQTEFRRIDKISFGDRPPPLLPYTCKDNQSVTGNSDLRKMIYSNIK